MTMNDNVDPAHAAWSRDLFAKMRDGASWAVPRSGLIFVKCGEELHLTARMPHDPRMPCTADQLHEQQDGEFNSIQRTFHAAGIKVVDKSAETQS